MGTSRDNRRSGRGNGRSRKKKSSRKNDSKKPAALKMVFAPLDERHATAPYSTVLEHVLSEIYAMPGMMDVIEALKTETPFDKDDPKKKPKLKISSNPDKEAKALEDAANKETFVHDSKIWSDRCREYDVKMVEAYGIMEKKFLSKQMRSSVQTHEDYRSADAAKRIDGNPILLLQTVKIFSEQTSKTQYPQVSLFYAFKNLFKMRQEPDEELADYAKRLKQKINSLKQLMGDRFLDEFCKKTPEYASATDKTDCQKEALDSFMSVVLLKTVDPRKYGSLVKRLAGNFSSRPHDPEYPTKWKRCVEVLASHPWDQEYYDWKKARSRRAQERENDDGAQDTSFAQAGDRGNKHADYTCHCCGQKGHIAPNCPKKNTIPKDQWFKERAFRQLEEHENNTVADGNDSGDDDSSIASTETQRSTNSASSSRSQRSSRSSNRRSGGSRGRDGITWNGVQIAGVSHVQSGMTHKQSTSKSKPAKFLDLLKVIILDSGSTLHTFANPDFLTDIRPAEKSTRMATNGGIKKLSVEGDVHGFDTVWFDATTLANIFSLELLRKKYRVTYDSDVANTFFVHTDKGILEFQGEDGLYTFRPSREFMEWVCEQKGMIPEQTHLQEPVHDESDSDSDSDVSLPGLIKRGVDDSSVDTDDSSDCSVPGMMDREATDDEGEVADGPRWVDFTPPEHVVHVISTVEEQRHGLTERQYQRAVRARYLYHAIGRPTIENFKHILKANTIRNCPVTVEDVKLAERLFGPDVGTLKGKSKRRKPMPVVVDNIEIPDEIREVHKDVTLCIDIFFVNNAVIFHGIDTTIKFRGSIPLANRTHDEIYKALDQLLRHYNRAGHQIIEIRCDGEYKAMFERVADELDIKMNYTTADEHEPTVENSIKTVKERIRAAYNMLPFKAIPKLMSERLAMIETDNLNLFPVKGGVSPYYSPHAILSGEPVDYNKRFQVPFGAYVQGNNEATPYNSMEPRTIDCIYLRPLPIRQGGHELMDLRTGRKCTRRVVTPIPMPDWVIKRVETMAKKQGVKELKYGRRGKGLRRDTTEFTGVDEDLDDESYSSDSESDSDDDLDDSADEKITREEMEDLTAEARLPIRERQDQDEPGGAQPEVEDVSDEEEESNDDEVGELPESDGNDEEHTDEATQMSEQSEGSRYPRRDRGGPVEKFVSHKRFVQATTRYKAQKWRLRHKPLKKLSKKKRGQRLKHVWFQENQEWLEHCHNLHTSVESEEPETVEYKTGDTASLIAHAMIQIMQKGTSEGYNFAQQFMFKRGLKIFKERGEAAAIKEIDQLVRRNCFTPISVKSLTAKERAKCVNGLMFLCEKRDKTVKGRLVYNGKPTRAWLSSDEAASPTVTLEAIFITSVIEAFEGRDIMTADVPNAFIQTEIPKKDQDERIVMKITGVLVDLLVAAAPEVYADYMVYENGEKVIYNQVLRALYGMLVASLLWYKNFRADLEDHGFKFNSYDPCVANKEVEGSQHTVCFHVDDLKSSHVNPKVNDDFEIWLNDKYGKYGAVKAVRGHFHDYLGMNLDFSEKGKVKVEMYDYIAKMVDESSLELGPNDVMPTPATDNLLSVKETEPLEKKRREEFHTIVAKGLFACKRSRPDIHPTIAVLCTRVAAPNEDDWSKLVRLLKYCNGTRKDLLILSADDLQVIKWYVDASFAVHPDFKSHSGGVMTMGSGAIQSHSRKQKLNTRSSTEAELVGVDDFMTPILWTRLFLEEQGVSVKDNILYQDNKSAILLEKNGKRSSGKRTRALNIRYFFVTDQVEKKNLSIEYCPTGDMWADYMTKPLQGATFEKFKKLIMGS